jgi:acyl carrier protein
VLTLESALDAIRHILGGEGSVVGVGCEVENITTNASLRDDLGLDSLDFVELAMELEESLGLEEIEDIDEAATVGDVARMLTRKKVINPARLKQTLEAMEKAKGAEAALAKKVAAERVKANADKKEKAETPSVMAGVHAKARTAGA